MSGPRLSGHWQQGLHNQAMKPSVVTQGTRRIKRERAEAYWRPRLLAAWRALEPPRTIKALAAALNELTSTIQSRLRRYHLTLADLNTLALAPPHG